MERLKQTFKENLLNENRILESINSSIKPKQNWFNQRELRISLGMLSLIILALFVTNLIQNKPDRTTNTIGITTPRNNLAFALVSVDINPSFELYVDLEDKVIEISPLNEEAKSLSLDELIGLEVEDVVENLIEQAQNKGFINLSDLNQDTVIISTINYGLDGEKLIRNIQVKLRSSLTIDRTIKSYILKATDKDREKAKEENISLGIFMLNGIIQNNGVPMSVQLFVSDLNNLEKLEEYAEKINGAELVEIIQVLIDELQRTGVDVSTFQNRLNTDGEDLEELVEDLKDEFEGDKSNHSSENVDNHEQDDNEEYDD